MASGFDHQETESSTRPPPLNLLQTARTILRFLEQQLSDPRVCKWLLSGALLLALVFQLRIAETNTFTFDELVSVYVSSLGAPSSILHALRAGVDDMPLFHYWLTGQISHLPLDPHIAARLPAIAGYLLGMIGACVFVARRYGWTLGLSASLLIALSPVSDYATDVRPYAIVVGLLAIAAVFWQTVENGWWHAIAFAVCLVAAVGSHPLAIVTLGIFGAAELMSSILSGNLRWRVWVSLLLSSVPFFLSLPALLAFRSMFGPHFWSKPHPGRILLSFNVIDGIAGPYPEVFVLFAVIASISFFLKRPAASSEETSPGGFTAPEVALSIGFLLLPVLLVFLTTLAGSGYVERYSLSHIIGSVFAFVFLFRTRTASSYPAWLLCALLLVFADANVSAVTSSWPHKGWQAGPAYFQSEMDRLALAAAGLRFGFGDETPIVFQHHQEYLQTLYDQGSKQSRRFYFRLDAQAALKYSGRDSGDQGLRTFSAVFPALTPNVVEAGDFIVKHKTFLVWPDLTRSSGDWLLRVLIDKGIRLQSIQNDGSRQIFLATSP